MKRVTVRYQGREVGEIGTNGRDTLFFYHGTWLQSGVELSPRLMRLRREPYPGTDPDFYRLPPLFADSLPDRYARQIMKAWFEKHRGAGYQPTPVEQLAYVGERGLGALTYHPSVDDFPKSLLRDLDLRQQEKLAQSRLGKPSAKFIEQMRQGVGSVGGRYPKIICAENPTTGELYEDDPRLEGTVRRWIIKFFQEETPYGGQTEWALAQMARDAGIVVPETRLFHSMEERSRRVHFGIERFDWIGAERIHVASLAALTGRPSSDTSFDYRDFLAFTLELTRDLQEVAEVYRRMVYNIAVGNADDHTKNHAFRYRDERWSLSPAYDVTFCPGTPGAPTVRAMPVGGTGLDITRSQILELGDEAGLKKSVRRTTIDQVCQALSKAEAHLEAAKIPKAERKRLLEYFTETTARLSQDSPRRKAKS
jgi:serine/threonine-protein kinase HipA